MYYVKMKKMTTPEEPRSRTPQLPPLSENFRRILANWDASHARELLESREEVLGALTALDHFYSLSPCPTSEELEIREGGKNALQEVIQTLVTAVYGFERLPDGNTAKSALTPEDRNDAAACLSLLQLRLNVSTDPLFTKEEWGKIQSRFQSLSEKIPTAFDLLAQEVAKLPPVKETVEQVQDEVEEQL